MNYTFQDLFAYTISNFSNSNDNLAKMFLDITKYLSFKTPKSKYTILESDNNTQIIATFTNSEFDASHMCAVPYHCVVSAKTLITTLKFYNSSTKTLIEISIDSYDAVSYNPSTKSYYPFKNKRFTKEDAIDLKFFVHAATRCLRKKGKSFIYDDEILMSAYDKLHDMSLV